MNRHKVAESIAKFFLRSGRGQGLISRVTDPIKDVLDGTVYLFALKGLLGITISIYILIIIVIAKRGLEVFLGWLDERIGFWKAENYYGAYQLNTFNQELMGRVKDIQKKVR